MAPQPNNIPRLPPLEPQSRAALDRAIVLLGARAKGEALRASKVQEIVGLLGRYPDPVTARAWKSALKALRDEEKTLDCVG